MRCSQGGKAGSFGWFCRSTSLQALCKKAVPQFVFKTHQLSGKVHLQYLLAPARGISWHQPARSMLGLQSRHQQRGLPASRCSSSKIFVRLWRISRAIPTPAEEVPQSRSDTASLPSRGVCGKPCSQPPQTCPAGHNPVLFQAALSIQRSHSRTQPALLCPPLALEIPSQTPLGSLDGFRACQIPEQSSPGARGTRWLLTAMPSSFCTALHGVAFEGLCLLAGNGRQPAALTGATPTLLRYLPSVPHKDWGKCSSCLPPTGTQSDSPCSQHLVSLTRQENKDTM